MKHLFKFLALPFFLLAVASCSNNSDNPNQNPNLTTFKADLKGSNEAPAPGTPSTATGKATLVFDNTTKIFTLTVTHDVVNPTMGHIHKGAVGVSGSPVFPSPTTSFTFPITNYTSPVLTQLQEDDLRAGLYYVNIHSDVYKAGEIRGQLNKETTSGGGGGTY